MPDWLPFTGWLGGQLPSLIGVAGAATSEPLLWAVVAMQYEITDRSAIEFSRSFYDAVADGLPIDAAVAEARTAVKMKSVLEWGTPVLYVRSSDGRIFDVLASVSPARTTPQTEGRQEEDSFRRYRDRVESAWAYGELHSNEVQRLRDLANNELGLDPGTAANIERRSWATP